MFRLKNLTTSSSFKLRCDGKSNIGAGAPKINGSEHVAQERHAIVYKPQPVSTQSGTGKSHLWRVEFDRSEPRWSSSMMGWSSSRDAVRSLKLSFPTMEAAVEHLKEQGMIRSSLG